MRTLLVLAVGFLLGATVVAQSAQQNRLPGIIGLDHIAISTDDMPAALAFYQGKMGFDEAFTVRDEKGQPTLVYLYASKDTFVELAVARPDRPPGLYHYGVVVEDIQVTAAALAQRGVKVENIRRGSTGSMIGTVAGPHGVNIELLQQGTDSLQRRAVENWKAN